MNKISLSILRENVLNECDKTTSYMASSMQTEDNASFLRLRLNRYNKEMTDRSWSEASNIVMDALRDMVMQPEKNIDEAVDPDETFAVTLEMSDLWPEHLTANAQKELFNFFVCTILSRWFDTVSNGQTQDDMANKALTTVTTEAAEHLERLKDILATRMRPKMRDREKINYIKTINDVEVEIE